MFIKQKNQKTVRVINFRVIGLMSGFIFTSLICHSGTSCSTIIMKNQIAETFFFFGLKFSSIAIQPANRQVIYHYISSSVITELCLYVFSNIENYWVPVCYAKNTIQLLLLRLKFLPKNQTFWVEGQSLYFPSFFWYAILTTIVYASLQD